MSKSSLEKIVEKGVKFLSEIFPFKTYLYFPLLSASFVWAVRRVKDWKKEIFSWEIWLDPERIVEKPEEYILNFFERNDALSKVFEDEIEKKDLEALREAYLKLSPLLELEDPFLCSLFHKELEEGNFRKIIEEFESKVSCARKDIEAFDGKSNLLDGLKDVASEMVSLGLDLISRDEVQDVIAHLIKKNKKGGNE
jgi:hypothetical protein